MSSDLSPFGQHFLRRDWQKTCSVQRRDMVASYRRREQTPGKSSAFSLVEVVVAMAVVGVIAVSLYAGMGLCLNSVSMSRQTLRATEIALETMESIRVFHWDQINSNGFVPTTFYAPFAYDGTTNDAAGGLTYTGTVTISSVSLPGRNYSNDVRLVTVDLNWTSGALARHRQLSTYVSRYGIQNKLYY